MTRAMYDLLGKLSKGSKVGTSKKIGAMLADAQDRFWIAWRPDLMSFSVTQRGHYAREVFEATHWKELP